LELQSLNTQLKKLSALPAAAPDSIAASKGIADVKPAPPYDEASLHTLKHATHQKRPSTPACLRCSCVAAAAGSEQHTP